MFTGIIEGVGKLISFERRGKGARIILEGPWAGSELNLGESISVAGVCLTLASVSGNRMEMDLSEETLLKTAFSSMERGRSLNLERALKVGDRLGGHFVTGHVDAVGEFLEKKGEKFYFKFPKQFADFIIEKGSIAIDGVSLTTVDVLDDSFGVALIPETLSRTTLGGLKPGAKVHLEFDMILKYLAKLAGKSIGRAGSKGSGITAEFLSEKGFL